MTPGELLVVLCRDWGWSQATLAEVIGRPPQVVSEIAIGRKRVTAATALQLQAAFGLSAPVWLLMQAEADLTRHREAR